MSCFNKVIENLKESLDKGFVTGASLMDLSKNFNCIPHDLLVAKLRACGMQLILYIHTLNTESKM